VNPPVRVLVADDQALLRGSFRLLVDTAAGLTVVGEAATGAETVDVARREQPDVVLMDVRMPVMDGVAATRAICAAPRVEPPTRVLVLTTFSDDQAVHGALLAGASGYLLKHAAPQALLSAIREVASGNAWLDPSVTGSVIDALAAAPRAGQNVAGLCAELTSREREVLVLMAQGLSNTEIGERLVLGSGTVKTHVSRVLMKTASRDRAQAIALAYQSGLVVAPPRR
jgi:DNA-binding NarL/FixJ family response regulator